MVQIGNEIPSGILWNSLAEPVGPSSGYPWTGGNHDEGFDRLAALLNAGIQGTKDGANSGIPGPEPLTMIHHDRADRLGDTSFFLGKLLTERELDFDVIGFSYYPLWHYTAPQNGQPATGTLADVRATLNYTAETFGKPIVIAETGFTRSNENNRTYEFAETPAGQQQFLQALVDLVQDVPYELGRGVFWWYAEARPVTGLPIWQGGRYGLFDQDGVLLPAADVFDQVQGDYNFDDIVDMADYTVWRDAMGQAGQSLAADGDADGRVDNHDYEIWRRNFGAVINRRDGSGNLSVPEPFGTAPALQALMFLAFFQRGHNANCVLASA
jgi:arabinogalactan endo-1,4-beta-galactosidase